MTPTVPYGPFIDEFIHGIFTKNSQYPTDGQLRAGLDEWSPFHGMDFVDAGEAAESGVSPILIILIRRAHG